MLTEKRVHELKIFAEEIRVETLKIIHSRGFGHVGGSMSLADAMAVLYGEIMNIRPEEPRWELAVYDRILGMMVERAVYDMQSENVSEEEIEAVLTEINRRLAEDDGSARQNEKEIILEKEAMLRKRMQMAAEVRQ